MSERANAAESAYMGRVAQCGCVLCMVLGTPQTTRTTVHHIKHGTGIGERSQHYLTAALCDEHHQGPNGVHGLGTKGFYLRYKCDELDLLSLTIEAVFRQIRQELAKPTPADHPGRWQGAGPMNVTGALPDQDPPA